MTLRQRSHDILSRLEFGDIALLICFAAFLRQYFWIIGNNYVAWPLTIAFAVAGWLLFIGTRPDDRPRMSPSFWLIVVPPLAFVFLMRLPFPDTSFDVLNYHLLHSQRALAGALHIPGDMFPGQFPTLDPSSDIVTGITRWLLGYRLGVLINLIAIIWAGTVIDRILRQYIARVWTRAFFVLTCLFIEQILAEINNYMVDLLVLPLLLEATWMILEEARKGRYSVEDVVRFSLYLGMSVGLKITNLAFAGPLALIFIVQLWPERKRIDLRRSSALAVPALLLPVVPWSVYLFWRFGNPVFPLYNKIFGSPYWSASNFIDSRWGPNGLLETLVWPLLVVFSPERLSERNVYSGRLSLAWAVSVILLVAWRKDGRTLLIAILILVCGFIWSAGTGYIRYGLYLELMAAVSIVCVAAHLANSHRTGWRKLTDYVTATALGLVLISQSVYAGVLSFGNYEWSGRQTIFEHEDVGLGFAELLTDRSIVQYQTDEQRALFSPVDVWVETSPKTCAMMVMLKPGVPGFTYLPTYYQGLGSKDLFASNLALLRGKRFFSLIIDEEEGRTESAKTLRMLGFSVKSSVPVKVPYFSPEEPIPMVLMELEPPSDGHMP